MVGDTEQAMGPIATDALVGHGRAETAFLETESTWVEARRADTEAEESGFKKLAGSAE